MTFVMPAPLDVLFAILLAAVVLVIAKVDCERFEIPDWTNLAVFGLGLIWIATTSADVLGDLTDTILRAGASAGFLCAVKVLYCRLRKAEGLGWGDVKLAAAGSPWLSWQQVPVVLLIAAGAGLLIAVVQAARTDRVVSLSTAFPLGALLAPAIWIVWFVGLLGLL
jgi:leader peptidase (prepilin peptidase)/N-methyltransferase